MAASEKVARVLHCGTYSIPCCAPASSQLGWGPPRRCLARPLRRRRRRGCCELLVLRLRPAAPPCSASPRSSASPSSSDSAPPSRPKIHNAPACLNKGGWHDIAGALTYKGTHHVFQVRAAASLRFLATSADWRHPLPRPGLPRRPGLAPRGERGPGQVDGPRAGAEDHPRDVRRHGQHVRALLRLRHGRREGHAVRGLPRVRLAQRDDQAEPRRAHVGRATRNPLRHQRRPHDLGRARV